MGKNSGIMVAIGPWSYLGGIVLALLAGIFAPANAMIMWVLGLLGLLVGLLNVTDKEVQLFLTAAIAFLLSANSLVSVSAVIPAVGSWMPGVFSYLVFFTAPAAAIVAVKALYSISKDQ
ncbi:hypothetical protein AUJ17_01660 [Candidatus Micrarchaeota archaeon CG1_02_47_40]|nr:MAG: hypothetical protein AUJ17_01660 [Candidatus Micrarchaeota archaeon CG1_02_47_40]